MLWMREIDATHPGHLVAAATNIMTTGDATLWTAGGMDGACSQIPTFQSADSLAERRPDQRSCT